MRSPILSVLYTIILIRNSFLPSTWIFPRKVRYKPRRRHHQERNVPSYRQDRTYADFEAFMVQHPNTPVVEMDVVEGSGGKNENVLLTLLLHSCLLMLVFLLPADRREYVREVFDFLYDRLFP